MDKYIRKANIYFKEPIIKRYVKSVEWLEEERVYRRDVYDCFKENSYSAIHFVGTNEDDYEVDLNFYEGEAKMYMNITKK